MTTLMPRHLMTYNRSSHKSSWNRYLSDLIVTPRLSGRLTWDALSRSIPSIRALALMLRESPLPNSRNIPARSAEPRTLCELVGVIESARNGTKLKYAPKKSSCGGYHSDADARITPPPSSCLAPQHLLKPFDDLLSLPLDPMCSSSLGSFSLFLI